MAKSAEDARKELDKEFRQFREELGHIVVALEDVQNAGPTDDISALLSTLEDTVKRVRTGGLLGSGANGHKAARQDWLEAQGRS